MKATKGFLGILIITMALLTQAQGQSFLTNGLVAYYPLNGNANDATGNGNNGTPTGVVYTTNRFGIPNGAASFAGNASSAITINSTNLNVAPYFTVSAWINFQANAGTDGPRVFSTSGYDFGMVNTAANRQTFVTEDPGPYIYSSNTIPAGTWCQLLAVCDGSQMYLYVNGVLEGSVPAHAPTYTAGIFPAIGMLGINGHANYGGLLSDIRIYNVPFTSNQVAQLYANENTPPPAVPTNGLVAYYPLNGNANDATGNGNNGTPTGVVYTTNRFGIPNSAASFTGNSSSVITINSTNLNVAPYFTVSAWVNFQANAGTYGPRVFSTSGYDVGMVNTAANRQAFVTEDPGPYIFSSNTIPAGTWWQLVAVCDGSQMYLYVNGVLEGSVAAHAPTYTAGVFPAIGILGVNGLASYGGLLSDIRVYNAPLTSNQVTQLYTYENTPPPAVPVNGLVAYYPLNGNANDATGNGNNGTPSNISYTTNRFGIPNSAASFAGNSSSKITINSTNINVAPYFTVSLWANFTANTGNGNPRILSTTGYRFQMTGTSSSRIPFIAQWGFSGSIPTNTVLAGSWSQLVGVCDGSNILFYVNGVITSSAALGQPLSYIPGVFSTLGVRCEGGSDDYGGLLSDVRIYNVPFTSNQVAQLYANENTPPPAIPTNGLVAYYPLNGNANDATGNGNNGTPTGVVYTTNRFGIPNSAASFIGNASSAIAINTTNLNVAPYFTVSAWINFHANAGTYGPRVFSTSGYDVGMVNTAANRQAFVTEDPGPYIYSSNTIPAGTWWQLVAVCDGSQMYLYVNGVLEGTVAAHAPTYTAGVFPAIGMLGVNGLASYGGLLSDIRIYNVPLTSNQVVQLYAHEESTPPLCTPHDATATATVVDNFVVAAVITDEGCGYTNTPLVLIQGGSGMGATAIAQVNNGEVTNITITDAGINYTSTPTIYIGFPPAISAQPQPVVVNANTPASFSVTATGVAPLSYQWSFNSTNIAGATNSSFTIANVVQTNLGLYSVVVTNVFGYAASSNAMLSMNPFIVTPFTGAVAFWGKDAMFSVTAWGTGPLSYQWFDNGSAIAGATNSTLDLPSIQFTNGGLYTVVVTSPLESVTNTPGQVVVEPAGVSLGFCPTVTISGVVGYSYIIQGTSNFANPNAWITLTNLTLTQPVQLWVDTNIVASSPSNPQYYYRVLPGQ